jgi:hypothetical protein
MSASVWGAGSRRSSWRSRGVSRQRSCHREAFLPEADGINFVTRVKIPVLMLNPRYDDLFPVESSQLPLFRLLGTPERDKKHVIYESGHGSLPHREEVRETLDFLDKYLGPVKR